MATKTAAQMLAAIKEKISTTNYLAYKIRLHKTNGAYFDLQTICNDNRGAQNQYAYIIDCYKEENGKLFSTRPLTEEITSVELIEISIQKPRKEPSELEAKLEKENKELLQQIQELKQQKTATGETSDGYYTFDELYMHRNTLFIALMKAKKQYAEHLEKSAPHLRLKKPLFWYSDKNSEGSEYPGWLVCGIDDKITYYVKADFEGLLQLSGMVKIEKGLWDGHKPEDVLERISKI